MPAGSPVPGTEVGLQSTHGASGALGRVGTGEGAWRAAPKPHWVPLRPVKGIVCAVLLLTRTWRKPCGVPALVVGKLKPSGKKRQLRLHHAAATLPVLGWHVGREVRLQPAGLPSCCVGWKLCSLGFPFQQEHAGCSEKIDRNNQSKGMAEKTSSGRDDLVDEYDRSRKSWVGREGWFRGF